MDQKRDARSVKCSLAQIAYEQIRDEIITQTLKPGSLISEYVYAEKLGMSRTPIREAIKRLSNEGFISIIPQKGAIISDYSLGSMVLCLEASKDVEAGLAGSLAKSVLNKRLVKKQFDKLYVMVERMRELSKHPENESFLYEWIELDNAFHAQLITRCENKYIVLCAQQLRLHLMRLAWFTTSKYVNRTLSSEEHLVMLDYICEGDIENARSIARQQCERTSAEIKEAYLMEDKLL